MAFTEKRILGSTGLKVGALGVAARFGAPSSAFEEAYERGCNYFPTVRHSFKKRWKADRQI